MEINNNNNKKRGNNNNTVQQQAANVIRVTALLAYIVQSIMSPGATYNYFPLFAMEISNVDFFFKFKVFFSKVPSMWVGAVRKCEGEREIG